MKNTNISPIDYNQAVKRPSLLRIVAAAFEVKEYQFARQACLSWLANFPGDLYISYLHARSLTFLKELDSSITLLEKICNYDPEFIEPLSLLTELTKDEINKTNDTRAILFYLQNRTLQTGIPSDWINNLAQARQAYEQDRLSLAEDHIRKVLTFNPATPLPAMLHLQIAWKKENLPLFNTIASIYSKKWPDCIQIKILTALALLQSGNDSAAVENLHWCAAYDTAAQVITRLLGPDHRFKPLWPENLQIYFDLPIPAAVATKFGWNQLQPGDEIHSGVDPFQRISRPFITSTNLPVPKRADSKEKFTDQAASPAGPQTAEEISISEDDARKSVEILDEIQTEFDRLAKSIKKPALSRADGRFPVYVLLSSKTALANKYGANTTIVIDQLLQELTDKIGKVPNWSSLQYYPDDPACTTALGITPNLANDAWKIKLSLTDLDTALAARGEMIGALLIVGGNDIIPFHRLPNPTDDSDPTVPSDNPYATTDENYFIPQWPVGRLPDEKGSDAGFLLEQLRFMNTEYQYKLKARGFLASTFIADIVDRVSNFMQQIAMNFSTRENLGYSAKVWQQTSALVFETIGNPKKMFLSPPTNFQNINLNDHHSSKCAYFNLHGLQDAPEWFGQKDFTKQSNEPDYPVAISPSQFNREYPAPEIVFSEACYGAFIEEKKSEESMALSFLASGSRCVIGSTCIAYGSVTEPLIAADMVAQNFLKQVLAGYPVGYALMRAKLNLAREMTNLQGYLDGEDQKTILSFVLYGDPLGSLNNLNQLSKPLIRPKYLPKLKTISDSHEELHPKQLAMPKEILKEVKKVVSEYLPGLGNANLSMNPQLANFTPSPKSGKGNRAKKRTFYSSQRYVVTLKKSIDISSPGHFQYARITFDHQGRMIKLSSSR